MSSPINTNYPLSSNSNEHFISLIAELQQQLRDSHDEIEKFRSDVSRQTYYRKWIERRADTLDAKNSVIRLDIEGLKAEHEVEIEQLQQENQQLYDQIDDLRDHIDQLAEMIPDEPEKDPEEDPWSIMTTTDRTMEGLGPLMSLLQVLNYF
ncbi:UNVERIFIED_CONTAM: hypothetical protein Sradi_2339500 [Sesamum radiatum]|uniref:Uncharacterized protein n=1 Tax=Sesamum radiatum TaxID=300843 RepID=A0AAW2T5S3_SESRA